MSWSTRLIQTFTRSDRLPVTPRSDWSSTIAITQNMRAGSSKRPVRNGNSKHTLPSPIQIGPKRFFGEQRVGQTFRIEEELKLKGWNGNEYRRVWRQQRRRVYGLHQSHCLTMSTRIRHG